MKSLKDDTAQPPQEVLNLLAISISGAALAMQLWVHNPFTFGIRSTGTRGGAALLVMFLFYMGYWGDNRTPLLLMIGVTAMFAVISHISAIIQNRSGGDYCHTRYAGRPYVMAVVPFPETQVKRIEPFVLLAVGWAIHRWNCPLGSFVMTSAFCQALRMLLGYVTTRTRILDLRACVRSLLILAGADEASG